jgi:hypothetical protein
MMSKGLSSFPETGPQKQAFTPAVNLARDILLGGAKAAQVQM